MNSSKQQNGNTAVIVVIVLALLLGAGAAYYFLVFVPGQQEEPLPTTDLGGVTTEQNQNGTDEPDTSTDQGEESENIVRYDGRSFLPKTLTISEGETVTFINDSNQSLWVASNPHPIHTDFSAFDAHDDLDEYSFTFTEKGTYNYHNHLRFISSGTVIVN